MADPQKPNLPVVVQPSQNGKVTVPPPAKIVVEVVGAKPEKDDPGIANAVIAATGTVLSSAAWPIAIVTVAIIFKTSIAGLINRVKSFKGPGGIEVSAQEIINTELTPTPADVQPDPEVTETVRLPPIEAIVTSWVRVERAIERLFDRSNLAMASFSSPRIMGPRQQLDHLYRSNIIGPSLMDEVRTLSRIRNSAVHNPEEPIIPQAVLTYVSNADSVVKIIDAIPGDLDAPANG